MFMFKNVRHSLQQNRIKKKNKNSSGINENHTQTEYKE